MAQMGVVEVNEAEGQPDIVAEGEENPNLIEEIKDIEEVKQGEIAQDDNEDDVNEADDDKHPEKRMKAAYRNFEEERLKELR
jgi:hypothetical protein